MNHLKTLVKKVGEKWKVVLLKFNHQLNNCEVVENGTCKENGKKCIFF